MKSLIILLFPLNAFASQEALCLKQLTQDVNMSEQTVTQLLMSCNNQLLIGESVFLKSGKQTDKIIRKFYPRNANDPFADKVTEQEKADRLFQYNECQEISHNFKKYMSMCLKGLSNENKKRN